MVDFQGPPPDPGVPVRHRRALELLQHPSLRESRSDLVSDIIPHTKLLVPEKYLLQRGHFVFVSEAPVDDSLHGPSSCSAGRSVPQVLHDQRSHLLLLDVSGGVKTGLRKGEVGRVDLHRLLQQLQSSVCLRLREGDRRLALNVWALISEQKLCEELVSSPVLEVGERPRERPSHPSVLRYAERENIGQRLLGPDLAE